MRIFGRKKLFFFSVRQKMECITTFLVLNYRKKLYIHSMKRYKSFLCITCGVVNIRTRSLINNNNNIDFFSFVTYKNISLQCNVVFCLISLQGIDPYSGEPNFEKRVFRTFSTLTSHIFFFFFQNNSSSINAKYILY